MEAKIGFFDSVTENAYKPFGFEAVRSIFWFLLFFFKLSFSFKILEFAYLYLDISFFKAYIDF